MTSDYLDPILLVLWLLAAGFVAYITWSRRNSGVGIFHTYLALFWVNHWIASFISAIPWSNSEYPPGVVNSGFYESFIALIGLSVGAIGVSPFLCRLLQSKSPSYASPRTASAQTNWRGTDAIPWIYLLTGLFSYFLVAPFTQSIPTVGAFVTSLTYLLEVGVILLYWTTHLRGRKVTKYIFLLPMFVWPLITVADKGFLGIGASALFIVLVFVMRTSGNLKLYMIPALAVGYLGLSVFVTYSQTRHDIRSIVWSDSATLDARTGIVGTLSQKFTLFDIYDKDQLRFLDQRLNQDYLIGMAIRRLDNGDVDFASGSTMVDALLMAVPRSLWQGKTVSLGGSALVNQYTGVRIAGTTTVATGHVMEFYINFGTIGVVIGSIILGTFLAIFDFGAARALGRRDWVSFAFWVLPALSFLQPENSLLYLVGGSTAAFFAIILTNYMIKQFITAWTVIERREAQA